MILRAAKQGSNSLGLSLEAIFFLFPSSPPFSQGEKGENPLPFEQKDKASIPSMRRKIPSPLGRGLG